MCGFSVGLVSVKFCRPVSPSGKKKSQSCDNIQEAAKDFSERAKKSCSSNSLKQVSDLLTGLKPFKCKNCFHQFSNLKAK